jgi:hypothetical protein
MARIEHEQERKRHVRPTFADCAARYVAQSRSKRHRCDQVACTAACALHRKP